MVNASTKARAHNSLAVNLSFVIFSSSQDLKVDGTGWFGDKAPNRLIPYFRLAALDISEESQASKSSQSG